MSVRFTPLGKHEKSPTSTVPLSQTVSKSFTLRRPVPSSGTYGLLIMMSAWINDVIQYWWVICVWKLKIWSPTKINWQCFCTIRLLLKYSKVIVWYRCRGFYIERGRNELVKNITYRTRVNDESEGHEWVSELYSKQSNFNFNREETMYIME